MNKATPAHEPERARFRATGRKLDILFLEDDECDASLVEFALRSGGLEFTQRRAGGRSAFVRALDERIPDVVLADYNLPDFDGRAALKLVRERAPHTPVIIVTGVMPDGAAVELLRDGAADYILKDRLSRLAPAISRALEAAEHARGRTQSEAALRESESRRQELEAELAKLKNAKP